MHVLSWHICTVASDISRGDAIIAEVGPCSSRGGGGERQGRGVKVRPVSGTHEESDRNGSSPSPGTG